MDGQIASRQWWGGWSAVAGQQWPTGSGGEGGGEREEKDEKEKMEGKKPKKIIIINKMWRKN